MSGTYMPLAKNFQNKIVLDRFHYPAFWSTFLSKNCYYRTGLIRSHYPIEPWKITGILQKDDRKLSAQLFYSELSTNFNFSMKSLKTLDFRRNSLMTTTSISFFAFSLFRRVDEFWIKWNITRSITRRSLGLFSWTQTIKNALKKRLFKRETRSD